jgi:DNA-binding LytR/AlgR family response regulator
MNAIIVEDEKAAVRNLKTILKEVAPEIEIIASMDTVRASKAWLSSNNAPDLIFMDIHLADGDCFQIFQDIEVNTPVIFTTAYEEYTLKAFKVNSIDYLLKPINPEDVKNAVQKYKKLTEAERIQNISDLQRIYSSNHYQKVFLIYYKDKIIPLKTDNIAFFYSRSDKVTVYSIDGAHYPCDKPLNIILEKLDPSLFFRANRKFVISRNAIGQISLGSGHRLSVNSVVEPEEEIVISKERVNEFKRWLVGY